MSSVNSKFNLVFFGTSPRSAKFLELAIEYGLKVDLVVSDPAKPIGKKQILTENPTVTIAKNNNILFETDLNSFVIARSPAVGGTTKQSQRSPRGKAPRDDIGLIFDFNKIIPTEIINLFNKGIINIHFSKLPQYKGPAPVQYTILNGDKEAWITYYLINEKVDAGQILTQTSLSLDMTENTETLYQKLIVKSAVETPKIIDNYLCDRVRPFQHYQQKEASSTTHKLTAQNCKIDWAKTPEEIERLIRAAYPEPGAWTLLRPAESTDFSGQAKRLKIIKAHLEDNKLIIDQVQLEGKNPVSWKQFCEGYPNNNLTI